MVSILTGGGWVSIYFSIVLKILEERGERGFEEGGINNCDQDN